MEQEQRKHEHRTGEEHTGQAKAVATERTQHLEGTLLLETNHLAAERQVQDSEGRTLQFSGLI